MTYLVGAPAPYIAFSSSAGALVAIAIGVGMLTAFVATMMVLLCKSGK